MDLPSLKKCMIEIENLSIENINFYVFYISIQSCKDCQTVQTLYKTRKNLLFLSYTFLYLDWSMKTKYLLYFQKIFPSIAI